MPSLLRTLDSYVTAVNRSFWVPSDRVPAQNFTRTRIGAVAVAAGVAGAILIGSTPVHATAIAPADSASADSLSITVHPDQLGNQLHPGFVGLSFGAATVAQDDYASADLSGYLRTLGRTGAIRIGGNSGDTTFWTSTGEPAPSWATSGTITPDKLHHLVTIVRGAGWKVILAVNLKHPDPARAADEARYARQTFGDSLLAIEIGNEPNFYYSSVAAYYTDFESYVAAIEQAAPGVGITGPDAETNHSSWLGTFAALEADHPDVTEISDHTYLRAPAALRPRPYRNCWAPARCSTRPPTRKRHSARPPNWASRRR